jgi:hypothetical protein
LAEIIEGFKIRESTEASGAQSLREDQALLASEDEEGHEARTHQD